MTPTPELSPGERILRAWPARTPTAAPGHPTSGDLFLTNRRILFMAKGGLFGRSHPPTSARSMSLEGIGGAAPHRTELRIGYGDRMVLEGIELDGAVFELGREASSRTVLAEIASARRARRKELGLPDDITPCQSCGRWNALGKGLCESCAPARK
ncbi:MAG: hypothetical protein ABSA63_09810 [Thermoplasmata archaeon]|jgi:hypothetical protein